VTPASCFKETGRRVPWRPVSCVSRQAFSVAPNGLANKVRRLIAEGLAARDAEESVDAVDSEREAFIEKYFHMRWPNPPVYRARLNTVLGVERVTRAIPSLKAMVERQAST
jgi:hypothetical protein